MITFLTSALAFLFALGLIVFVHELGHHLVAKAFGVRVLTFSLGFGKRLWGFEHGGTDYRVSALPLGGYVRMAGEHPEENVGDPGDFMNKPRWQRILIYLAGPLMNGVLSVALFTGVFMHGISVQGLQNLDPVVEIVQEDSPAEAAGLQSGDRVLSVNGESVATWSDLDFIITTSVGKTLTLEVQRGDETLETELVPRKISRYEIGDAGFAPRVFLRTSVVIEDSPAFKAGFRAGDAVLSVDGKPITTGQAFVDEIEPAAGREVQVEIQRGEETQILTVIPDEIDGKGKIGVHLGIYRPLPFGEAVVQSVYYNVEIVDKTLQVLGKLFTRDIAPKSALSGPIEIAAWSGRAAQRGFDDLIFLMGFLSISIGFMNLLPIPVLDGGHIAILLAESVMRRDLSLELRERFTQAGLIFLMLLMSVVIYFDLSKNLPGLFGGS